MLKAVGDRLRDHSLSDRCCGEGAVDRLRGAGGAFNMCSFWYVECRLPATLRRHGSFSKKCQAARTMSGSIRSNSVRQANT
jgi:hypothetical protein